MTAPLFGLILAGGASTRMQLDKAAIAYHGQPQLHWTFELLSQVCAATFVSVRPDQRDDATRAQFPQIVDQQPGIGPIAGISAALAAHPKAAWLVVACDLPLVTEQTLRHLIERRAPQKIATAYRSSHDGLPEPLCAIWEPGAREAVLAHIAGGKQCPRKLLINSDVLLLDLPDARALDNVNTREEFRAATSALGSSRSLEGKNRNDGDREITSSSSSSPSPSPSSSSSPSPSPSSSSSPVAGGGLAESKAAGTARKTLRVQYYAILREQAGRSDETLDTSAATPADLYAELRQRYPFQLSASQLKVALNSDFSDWHAPLNHGDTVVFIPPVAGG
jgi:molybdenum cofactor guanylyltransferase